MSDPSLNAIKHACTSSRLLLPDEKAADLDELLEGLREQYRPETTLDAQFVMEAARSIWMLQRTNRRYDEFEQALFVEQPDSTKWTEEQWHQLNLRTRYRTTAERSCTRALRTLAHIRGGRAQFQPVEVRAPKEDAKKTAEKGLDLPKAEPPVIQQRIVEKEAYPSNEQLRKATEGVPTATKVERVFEFADGRRRRFQMEMGAWRKLAGLEEARGDGTFLTPEEAA